MSKKAIRNTPGKSRKSCNESTRSNSPNLGKGSSGYDYAGRVRKCCINWHDCVQKWESNNASGLQLATKIVNQQLQKSSTEQDSLNESHSLAFGQLDNDSEMINDKENLVKNLDSLANPWGEGAYAQFYTIPFRWGSLEVLAPSEILTKFSSQKDIHKKMSTLASNFEAVSSLCEMKEGAVKSKQPVFETWSFENYVSLSQKLSKMFGEELQLKERLVGMVLRDATVEDRSKLMACLAMWLHQPYLDENYKQELELMLIETGLRTA